MEIRLKYSSYDSFEFKLIGKKSLNETIEIFNSYPWAEETAKIKNIKEQISYPTLKLLKDNGEYIEINGFNKNEQLFFNVKAKYKKIIWRVIIGLQYSDKEILDFIKNYFSESTTTILTKIKSRRHTMNSAIMDFLVYGFSDKDKLVLFDKDAPRYFEYKMKGSRAFSKVFFSLIFLLMPLGFHIYTVLTGNPFTLKIFLFLQLLLGLFAAPGLILFFNHVKHSKNIKLYFQKNNNKFIVLNGSDKVVLNKDEIETFVKHVCNASGRAPWTDFEYWKIKFKNGDILTLSDMIIDDMTFMKHFNILATDKVKEKQFLPLIKQATTANIGS